MAKRNQVTTDLRISADAQLKNSRGFLNQLDKMLDKFDFGDKMNNQLLGAKNQLKDYNKILEKVQTKSLISDEELKDLVKAGKEIANIITKTEKLYINLSGSELQKFSKEYIKQIKAQEAEIAKIKESYTTKTGKNFDKELANYDKIKNKVKELQREKDNLAKSGTNDIVTKEVDQLNKKLEEQKNKLNDIKKLQKESAAAYTSAVEAESQKRGYKNYNEVKNIKISSEDQIRRQLGTAEYKEQANLISTINREIKELEKTKQDTNDLDKEAIALAKQYKIENVSGLDSLKQQLKIKKDILNTYKGNKSALAAEQAVKDKMDEQKKVVEDIVEIRKAGTKAELGVIQGKGYNSKASLSASASATNKSINNLTSQLTEDGIENIVNNASLVIAQRIDKLTAEITKGNSDLAAIDETNKKLATQSERTADEGDIIKSGQKTIQNLSGVTNADGDATRKTVIASEKQIKQHILSKEALAMGRDLQGAVGDASSIPALEELKIGNFQNIFTDEANQKLQELSNKYLHIIEDLKRKSEYLKSDSLSEEEYEVLGTEGLKNLTEAKKLVNKMAGVVKKTLSQEMALQKQQQDEMIKHDSLGRPRFDGNNPVLKQEFSIEDYNLRQERIQQMSEAYNNADIAQMKLNVQFTQGENQLINYNKVVEKNIAQTKKETNAQIAYAQAIAKNANSLEKSAQQVQFLGSTFDDFKNKVGYFLSLNYALDLGLRKIRESANFVKEIDKDMVQIGLVLGKTSSQVWKNFDTYSKMADRLSTTTSDVTASMKLFYQQGLNTVEVNKMVEASAIAAALGESTMAEASETLTSIINSYNLSANQALSVTDKISQVAIVSAADFGELSTAIEKVASSAASAGLDLDHMMGYLAKMIETTREAPTNIGTALKTIVANFTQFKEDPSGLNEEGSEINKVDKALQSVNISLTDANGEVRDLGEVIDELGGKWKNLTRSQKAYLATAIAGTRQQSRFYALMNDYERTLELVNEATNSEGKATAQFAIYQNSLSAATQRLTNESEKFYNQLMLNDNLLKGLTNTGTLLLKVFNKLGPVFSTLFAGGALKGARSLLVQFTRIKDAIREVNTQSRTIEQVSQNLGAGQNAFKYYSFTGVQNKNKISSSINNTFGQWANKSFENKGGKEQIIELDNLVKVQEVLNKSTDNLTEADIQLLKANKNNLSEIIKVNKAGEIMSETFSDTAKKKIADNIQTQENTINHTINASVKWKEFFAQMALNAAIAAGVAVVGLIGVGIYNLITASHKHAVAMQEQAQAAEENYKQLEDIAGQYLEIANRINLTTEDKEELAEVTDNLLEQYPDLIAWIDAEGKAYAKTTKEIEDYLAAQEGRTLSANKNAALATLRDNSLHTNAVWQGVFGGVNAESDDKMYGEIQSSAKQSLHSALNNLKSVNLDPSSYIQTGGYYSGEGGSLTESLQLENYNMAQEWINYHSERIQKEIDNINNSNLSSAEKQEELYKKQYQTQLDYLKNVESAYKEYAEAVKQQFTDLAKNIYEADFAEYTNTNGSKLTEEQKTLASNLMKSRTDTLLSTKDNSEIANYLSTDYSNEVKKMAEQVSGLDNASIILMNDLMSTISTDKNLSVAEVENKINNLAQTLKDIPEVTELLNNQLKNYTTTIEGITKDTEQQELLKGLKTSTVEMIAKAKNNMIGDTSEGFNEVEFNNILNSSLKEDFLTDLDNLNTDNLGEIQQFKQKYAQILGQYGIDFLNEIIKNPEYDAEKVQEKFSIAQAGTTTQTKNGIGFENIAQGDTSQEDAIGELTADSESARRNIELVGQDLIVTGEEIADSFKESQQEAITALNEIILKSSENIKLYESELADLDTKGFENLNDSEKERYKTLQKNIALEQKRTIKTKELISAYKKLSIEQKAINENQHVITGIAAVNKEINSLKDLADIYQYVGQARMSQLDIIEAVAQNTDLLTALEVNERGELYLTKEGIEAIAAERISEAKSTVDAQIAKLEALKGMIDGDQAYSEYELEMLEEMALQWSNLSEDEKNALVTMAQQLGYNITSMDQWTTFVQKDLEGARKAWNEYYKAAENKDSNSAISGDSNGGVSTTSATSKEQKTKGSQKKAEIQEEIDRLKAISVKLGQYQKKPSALLKDINNLGDYTSNGGNDFDPIIEKLEKFYNYLRQLEEIEARLNRLREKRNLIDATKNYYIDDLVKENDLLREQQSIYNDYIRDQAAYLTELRTQIQEQFSNWAYFNEDGVIQVKQTEFTANSEKEEERLNNFLELVDLYQNEYNTREENINKLYEIENTQLENIANAYEKILTRVEDITEALNRQIDLLDHDMNMSFGNIGKFDIMDNQTLKAVEGIKTSQGYIKDFKEEMSKLNDEVKNGPFNELLIWDETLEHWRVNEEALQDESIIAKYEKMGYSWQDIDTYVRSVATESQAIDEALEGAVDNANEFAELLKSLIEDRIDIIKDFYSASTDELNKIFDTFENKMTDIDNQNNLFGVVSDTLEDKYLTLVTATVVLKQTIQDLKANKDGILEQIQKEYPEYIKMINGVAVVNKQAIEESTGLTEGQKADLLQLYGILEASEEQIEEMEDKLVDYFNTMLEMEEAKRDAIIDLKQQVHDELIARDQQEIDDLQEKYAKMSELDNEYYSELQKRVSDARDLRSQRQDSANIAQMQSRLSVMKADNSGTYNAELIELQRQLNTALQTQADEDVNRELERIQREQQEREEDRQMTIQAMENVLTFKDENSWYWQEAQKIWDEGPESITGFLRAANEYSNISDEQRALEFENLNNNMNTAFTTLQDAAGLSDRISDGVVTSTAETTQNKLAEINGSLNYLQEQMGEKISWANSENIAKLNDLMEATTNATNMIAPTVKDGMKDLYTNTIEPGVNGINNSIIKYLGEGSKIWSKIGVSEGILSNTQDLMNTGFGNVVAQVSDAKAGIVKAITDAEEEYLERSKNLFNWADAKYAEDYAPKIDTGASKVETPTPTTNSGASNAGSSSNSGNTSSSSSKPELKIGSTVTVKSGTKWYYDSYGTSPSGKAKGGKIYNTAWNNPYPINIDGLGWVKKTDIVGYSKGGYVDYTGIANVHGTQREPEAFLNAKQTRLFEMLRDGLTKTASNKTYDKAPSEIAKEEYNIDSINIEVKELADMDSVEKITRKVKEEIYKDSTGRNNMAVRRR